MSIHIYIYIYIGIVIIVNTVIYYHIIHSDYSNDLTTAGPSVSDGSSTRERETRQAGGT